MRFRRAVACAAALVCALNARSAAEGAVAARVIAVIDGDTLLVATAEGAMERVRLIGLDAPELDHPEHGEEPYAAEAAALLGRIAPAGSVVRLVPGGKPRDRYGRLLAYVYGRDGSLAEALVRHGLALACETPPNAALAVQLAAAQAEARRAGLGLWADPLAYAIVPAEEAGRHVGHCRGVAGSVSGISHSQDGRVLRLHFGRAGTDSPAGYGTPSGPGGAEFAAVIFAEDLRAFPLHLGTAYAGESIIVWGLIDVFAGRPEIRVHWPGQIEQY